jgi:hypothetical protein
MARSAQAVLTLLFALACLSCGPSKQAAAQQQRNEAALELPAASSEKVPALVLIERDPWAAVIGSDLPVVRTLRGWDRHLANVERIPNDAPECAGAGAAFFRNTGRCDASPFAIV